ncbi:hypothetical protein LTR85_000085 [Meristemomyces frigidus]|nr:hypothetical protein LTR85_000085 [Meristemomyces frigidus]
MESANDAKAAPNMSHSDVPSTKAAESGGKGTTQPPFTLKFFKEAVDKRRAVSYNEIAKWARDKKMLPLLKGFKHDELDSHDTNKELESRLGPDHAKWTEKVLQDFVRYAAKQVPEAHLTAPNPATQQRARLATLIRKLARVGEVPGSDPLETEYQHRMTVALLLTVVRDLQDKGSGGYFGKRLGGNSVRTWGAEASAEAEGRTHAAKRDDGLKAEEGANDKSLRQGMDDGKKRNGLKRKLQDDGGDDLAAMDDHSNAGVPRSTTAADAASQLHLPSAAVISTAGDTELEPSKISASKTKRSKKTRQSEADLEAASEVAKSNKSASKSSSRPKALGSGESAYGGSAQKGDQSTGDMVAAMVMQNVTTKLSGAAPPAESGDGTRNDLTAAGEDHVHMDQAPKTAKKVDHSKAVEELGKKSSGDVTKAGLDRAGNATPCGGPGDAPTASKETGDDEISLTGPLAEEARQVENNAESKSLDGPVEGTKEQEAGKGGEEASEVAGYDGEDEGDEPVTAREAIEYMEKQLDAQYQLNANQGLRITALNADKSKLERRIQKAKCAKTGSTESMAIIIDENEEELQKLRSMVESKNGRCTELQTMLESKSASCADVEMKMSALKASVVGMLKIQAEIGKVKETVNGIKEKLNGEQAESSEALEEALAEAEVELGALEAKSKDAERMLEAAVMADDGRSE